ncbi:L-fuculokinase [Actinomycetota bacterium]
MSVLGLDIGTTGTKAIVFDQSGNILSSTYLEYDTIYLKDGWVELDPEIIISSALDVLKRAAGKVKKTDPVIALGVSCLGSVMVPLDKKNNFLYNGFSFMDKRTVEDLEDIIGMKRFDFYRLTGLHINPYLTLNKLLWLRRNKPDIYKNTSKFYSLKEILMMKLGIEPKMDHCMASLTMLYDLNNESWSQRLFENCGIDLNTFPEIEESWKIIGEIKGKYLNDLDLNKKIQVIVGSADTGACPMGVGMITSGIVSNTIGTFEEAVLGLDKVHLTRDMMSEGISCHRSLLPGLYLYVGLPTTGGFALKWFKNQFCSLEEKTAKSKDLDPYDLILKDISSIKTDLLFLPHLNGSGTPNMDSTSRGAFLGISTGTTKKEFIKSLIEGLNYEIKLITELYEEKISGINAFYVTGGAVKSDQWMQIKADILGRDVTSFKVNEAGSLGVALMAAFASGIFKDIRSAIKEMVKVRRIYKGNLEKRIYYQKKYNKYKKLYKTLKEINRV